ncbi:MAG: hypothetical protein SVR94_04385, partial [Pseudomonadota bacterium]|nr:hypothetical protein [Pseudomonadota bacterium]
VPNACDLCAGYHDDSDANGNGIADGCEAEEINLPAKTTTHGDAIVGLLPLPPSIHMTVKIAGRGAGRVRSTPPGIHYTNQSSNCTQRSDFLSHCLYPYAAHSAYFDTATWVTLHAEAAPGSVFLGWGGDLDCADGVIWTLHNTVCIAYFQN